MSQKRRLWIGQRPNPTKLTSTRATQQVRRGKLDNGKPGMTWEILVFSPVIHVLLFSSCSVGPENHIRGKNRFDRLFLKISLFLLSDADLSRRRTTLNHLPYISIFYIFPDLEPGRGPKRDTRLLNNIRKLESHWEVYAPLLGICAHW
jgi:hypothetical protein